MATGFLMTLIIAGLLATVPATQRLAASRGNECPQISISCPDSVEPGKLVKFVLSFEDKSLTRQPTYEWKVTKGVIKTGQGTTEIEVDLNGENCEGLTATVTITGLPKECGSHASCTVCIH